MGYRLYASKVVNEVCFGKLYGYCGEVENELKELKSYQWLKKHYEIEGDECWGYGFNPRIRLNAKDFREFIELYNEDYMKYAEDYKDVKDKNLLNREDIKELLNSNEYKLLEWY